MSGVGKFELVDRTPKSASKSKSRPIYDSENVMNDDFSDKDENNDLIIFDKKLCPICEDEWHPLNQCIKYILYCQNSLDAEAREFGDYLF